MILLIFGRLIVGDIAAHEAYHWWSDRSSVSLCGLPGAHRLVSLRDLPNNSIFKLPD